MTARRVAGAKPVFADVPGILEDLARVLRSGRLMIGPYLRQFEDDFARYVGTRHAVGFNSCTAALEAVLRYVGVAGGDVVVPTTTFIATANAVIFAGARPVLADTNSRTLSLSEATLREAVTEGTRAVVLVHLAGLISSDVDRIREFCSERRLALIEDCAHAHGATFRGVKAGAFGLAGCFSFYPTKVMTTGTGGMITTDDEDLAAYARSVRLHGHGSGPRGGLDQIVNLGNDWFLDEFGAVIGVHQLASLDRQLEQRRELAARYRERLQTLPLVEPIEADSRCAPSYYKFMVLLTRPLLAAPLKLRLEEKHGIEAESLYWPPCHLQPLYRRMFGYTEGRLPQAEDALSRQICLPLHADLSLDDVDYVVECLSEELDVVRAAR